MTTTPDHRIPMLDLKGEVDELWDEITTAIHRVLRSGQFILGPEVEAFEAEAADYLGVKHAVGLNSGTDALVIGLRALGIGPGDEVITTAFSFFATAEAIVLVGAKPVFVDIRLDSFNIDPDLIEGAVTERTKAILPVHLYGNPAAMGKIMALAQRYDLRVLEDCAQSFGAVYCGDSEGDFEEPDTALVGKRTGAIGDVGAFSFYPTKSLGAYGDGGMLVTDDDDVALLARKLRNHGSLTRYQNEMVGYNSRLDAIQAAILRVKLRHVDRWTELRQKIAQTYGLNFMATSGINLPSKRTGHIFHQFSLRIRDADRDQLHATLQKRGVDSTIYYPSTLSAQCAEGAPAKVPCAVDATKSVLSLPIWPGLRDDDVAYIAETVLSFLSEQSCTSRTISSRH